MDCMDRAAASNSILTLSAAQITDYIGDKYPMGHIPLHIMLMGTAEVLYMELTAESLMYFAHHTL